MAFWGLVVLHRVTFMQRKAPLHKKSGMKFPYKYNLLN